MDAEVYHQHSRESRADMITQKGEGSKTIATKIIEGHEKEQKVKI